MSKVSRAIDVKRERSAYRQLRETLSGIKAVNSIWTIGHSTRSADEFNQILLLNEIGALVDVRSFPGSRRYSHFNKPELARNLEAVGIHYSHNPQLGGRRRPSPNSKNTNWQNASFRAYADHMKSEGFAQGIESLLEIAGNRRTVIMCAEALWWRCHRSLIADFLKAQGDNVVHILSAGKTETHPYTSAARIVDGRLSYEGLFVE
jgi:uncharacterized protein (DUF488 family)